MLIWSYFLSCVYVYAKEVVVKVEVTGKHWACSVGIDICGGLEMIEVEVTGNIELVVSVSVYVGVLEWLKSVWLSRSK